MTLKNNLVLIILAVLLTFSCSKEMEEVVIDEPTENTSTQKNPNILLIIADDLGLDACPGYSLGAQKPSMPNIESMIKNGITFNNAWSNPTCSPTRATILTGKYGFRTSVLQVDDALSTNEISIQKYLDTQLNYEYSNAVIGKWHLSKDANHPNNMGVNYYAGSLTGVFSSYSNWLFTENGVQKNSTEYNTTKYTDLAINWIDNQTNPWFLWLAYSAPHTPFHVPPTNLHSQGSLPTDQASIDANPLPYYLAALEAMDSEIGRLLSSMTSEEKENTVILFVGDNGTPNLVAQSYNSKRVKASIYQGGINVPLIVSGKNVLRFNETENALINLTDLYATIATIAGVSTNEINDSVSFKDLLTNSAANKREYIYSEIGESLTKSDKTIRNATHKYLLFEDGSEALFNLSNDPLETINLLNTNRLPLSNSDEIEKNKLTSQLNKIRS